MASRLPQKGSIVLRSRAESGDVIEAAWHNPDKPGTMFLLCQCANGAGFFREVKVFELDPILDVPFWEDIPPDDQPSLRHINWDSATEH